jgi:DNA-directed RNA polymerase
MEDNSKNELDKYLDLYVNHCSKNLFELFPKKNDAQVADAILEIFRNRENLEIFNKKALYIYIREIIDVKTPKITKISNELYDIFKTNYIFYLENGYAKF